MRELQIGEPLYKKGDKSKYFYFLLRGQLHLTVVDDIQDKFSHNIDENTFFGFRETSMARNDFATSKAPQTEVIQIDTKVYKNIITQNQLAASVEKIDFLLRFVPHLRDEDRFGVESIKKLEVHFMKEEYTKGYHVI